MCRVLGYLGKPIVVDDLLFKTDNSLVKQSYHPNFSRYLNLAGFGIAAWDNDSHQPEIPFMYKTQNLPFFDANLKNFVSKIKAHTVLAHVRGVAFSPNETVNLENNHPFLYSGYEIALAHNGGIYAADSMKPDLYQHIKPEIFPLIRGNVDSEMIYAVLLSQLKFTSTPIQVKDIIGAIYTCIDIYRSIRKKHNFSVSSTMNLFIATTNALVVCRYTFDHGIYPLNKSIDVYLDPRPIWATFGEEYGYYDGEYRMLAGKNKHSVIFSSEQLTQDTSTWIEIPHYSIYAVERNDSQLEIQLNDIHVPG